MSDIIHIPVLLEQTLEHLNPLHNHSVLDGTIGFGGHAAEVLKRIGPEGTLLGMDGDSVAIDHCRERFAQQPNVHLEHTSYDHFPEKLDALGVKKVDRFLLDLGISSFQLDGAGRGFSFQRDEVLDMRMNPTAARTAATILNEYPEAELLTIFREYGELRKPEKLVANIIAERKIHPFETTEALIRVLKRSFFFNNKRSAFIKTCTLVFQALRIEVNDELACLKRFLSNLEHYSAPGCRVAVISFHSLEDRIVKYYVRDNKPLWKKLTSSVVVATQDEIRSNSRSKCAKLRVFERKNAP